MNPSQATQVEKRNRLANLLSEAAQIEHEITCQYLFAAFSFKRKHEEGGVTWDQLELMRRWEISLLLVARQEMEHQGLAINLLTAIGESPRFSRIQYPSRARYRALNFPAALEPFNQKTMLRFICYEMPAELSPDTRSLLEKAIPGFKPEDYDGLYKLYREVRELIEELPEDLLFIGPESAQVDTAGIIPTAPPVAYDMGVIKVLDRKDALAAVDQIITEGEGAHGKEASGTHFSRLLDIYRALVDQQAADPDFVPGRQVVTNPRTRVESDNAVLPEGVTVIENPDTNELCRLFDQAYGALILLLMRFFAHTDETEAEIAALQAAAFFPMMTTIMRPLGEVLTQLPAFTDGSDWRAGPTFEFEDRIDFLPHRESAWRVISMQLSLLAERSGTLCTSEVYPEPVRKRLTLMHENLYRISADFSTGMKLGDDND